MTSFDDMPHEQMIAWLDQANSTAVQAVADRLAHAGAEIDKIADELKIRPQWVAWEGEGAFSFRAWSADLANATRRLAEYSKGASKQLSYAADAIALAKSTTPRPVGDPVASLKAALAAPNDPDSTALVRKLTEERSAAAREMEKLSAAYSHSVEGFGLLEKPEFPPPPKAIALEGVDGRVNGDYVTGGGTAGEPTGAGGERVSASEAVHGTVSAPVMSSPSHASVTAAISGTVQPVSMEIDSAVMSPTVPPDAVKGLPAPTGPSKPEGPLATPTVFPPGIKGGLEGQHSVPGGKASAVTRPPLLPGAANSGANPLARPPRDGGIVGGRPTAQTTGRPTGGLPRGTVIGGEGSHAGRTPMAPGGGGTGGTGSQSGLVGGRRLAGETGGVVGGRPQQPGRSIGRPFTPGGTGLVRGGAAAEGARNPGTAGRGAALPPQRPRDSRREDGERPDYLVEDEETWQQGSRRVVPPVID